MIRRWAYRASTRRTPCIPYLWAPPCRPKAGWILNALIPRILNRGIHAHYVACPPLFASEAEYAEFQERHARARIETVSRPDYDGPVYIGIDAGSTTIKAVVIDGDFNILKSAYLPNLGNPLPAVKQFLTEFYQEIPMLRWPVPARRAMARAC